MDIHWGEIATFGSAGFSAVAAGGAWFAAHRSNRTAKTVARIEQDRWHAELTPVFKVRLGDQEGNRAGLDFQLVGPLSLRHLDRVELTIASSDDLKRTDQLAGSRPQQELDAQVWGPYRFAAGADGVDATGQTVRPIALDVGRGRPFTLERTRPPQWQEGQDREQRWAEQWADMPIRLVIRCRKEGSAPWVVPFTVEMPPPAPWVH